MKSGEPPNVLDVQVRPEVDKGLHTLEGALPLATGAHQQGAPPVLVPPVHQTNVCTPRLKKKFRLCSSSIHFAF